jgi:cytidylate kinase
LKKELVMSDTTTTAGDTGMNSVLSSLRAAQPQEERGLPTPSAERSAFITISRQPGISTDAFAAHLANRLGSLSAGWKVWDRELVEKVAADHHIVVELVATLGQKERSWLEDFVRGLAISAGPPEELAVYRRVAMTIRALAQAGKAIVVGRGAVHITANMPGGVHVRLVAPWGYRVWRLADELGISRDEAAKEIERLEHEREQFYRRYWQHHAPSPEAFSITLNAVAGDAEHLAECVLPLVKAATMRTRTNRPQETARG